MKLRIACKAYGYSKHYFKKYRPMLNFSYEAIMDMRYNNVALFTDIEARAYLRITRFYKNYKQ